MGNTKSIGIVENDIEKKSKKGDVKNENKILST